MRVSVIIPLFDGEKYIDFILRRLIQNLQQGEAYGLELEAIFVNDKPENQINISHYINKYRPQKHLSVRLFNNEENRGIHYSRVRGLSVAQGEWIHFLDQDDSISRRFYVSQMQYTKSADVIVGNGLKETEEGSKMLYRFRFMQETVKYLFFYLFFSCRILSPGQCLIKKSSIPLKWREKIITENGADDFYLWILMLVEKCKFCINRERIYMHRHTTSNLSLDVEKMKKSDAMVCKYVENELSPMYKYIMNKRFSKRYEKKWLVSFIEQMNKI